jgi:hypothetical protein
MTKQQAEKNGRAYMSLQSKKYAVKVPAFGDQPEDWLFVTKDGPDGLEVVLYETREEAETQAKFWGGRGVVVEYART